jgi:hypothetical protein
MNTRATLFLFVLSALGAAAPYSACAQEIVPSIEWERLYKDSACYFSSVAQTGDGGYIYGGTIYDVAERLDPVGAILVKVGSLGEIQWEKIYGGGGIRSVRQTKEGTYVFAASTFSEDRRRDAWVVMVDGQGNKQWEKSFGGPEDDDAATIWQATDGGYVLAGHSPGPFGAGDGWVMRLDADGVKQWERSFGGESNDAFTSVTQAVDGGYLLAGSSYSPPSGNKESPNFGSGDAWLVKVDAQGNKQWEKSFGGTENENIRSLDQTMDGGVILGGTASSPPSGNKESRHFGGFDYWIVKVDAAGKKQWERSYGTSAFTEGISVVKQAGDGGFVLGANGTDSTGNQISRLIKIDPQGNQQWDQSFGNLNDPNGPYTVEIADLQQTTDGGYILSGRFDLPTAGIPASGCTWGSWAAKLERVVSSSGEAVIWKTGAGTVLESAETLNGLWSSNETEVLSIGHSSASPVVPAGRQRYYRLRVAGSTNELRSLSFGGLLSWPVDQRQVLEFSASKDRNWVEFTGDQGIVGQMNYAIVPQTLRQHYFRARKKTGVE